MCPEIEVDLELRSDKLRVGMESLDVLKRIPQEHYTQYKDKCIMVKDLVKIIEEEIDREKKRRQSRRKKEVGFKSVLN